MSASCSIAVIGGTGLTEFANGEVVGSRVTPYGDTSADIICSDHNGVSCLFLARHGNPHSLAPHLVNYRANIWALKQLGVKHIIAVNAVGGINPAMPADSLVLPHQIIDYTYGREHTFFDGIANPLQHIDFSHPFTASLSKLIAEVANEQGIDTHCSGTYGVTQGPRLETSAEIKRMAQDGCDIVGMTAMPEAGLARECEIDYASICIVVNPAAGCTDQLITMDEIHVVLNRGISKIKQLLVAVLPRLT